VKEHSRIQNSITIHLEEILPSDPNLLQGCLTGVDSLQTGLWETRNITQLYYSSKLSLLTNGFEYFLDLPAQSQCGNLWVLGCAKKECSRNQGILFRLLGICHKGERRKKASHGPLQDTRSAFLTLGLGPVWLHSFAKSPKTF
jgi:hypothetical protein